METDEQKRQDIRSREGVFGFVNLSHRGLGHARFDEKVKICIRSREVEGVFGFVESFTKEIRTCKI